MDHRGVQCKISYLISIPAAIKIAQLVCGIIVCSCASAHLCISHHVAGAQQVSQYCASYDDPLFRANGQGFVIFVGAFCVILTGALIVSYILELPDHSTLLPWVSMENIYTGSAMVLYLVAAIMESWYAGDANASQWGVQGYWITSAVFAFICWILYLVEVILRLISV